VRRTPFFRRSFTELDVANERRSDVDVARTEKVEAELDTFISRRHEKRVRDEGASLAQGEG
jgi:hypothetical protein